MTMKKTVKAKPAKRKYVKKQAKTNDANAEIAPYEIEAAPPSHRLNADLENTLKRVEATVKIITPGQAFIVPSKSRHSIKKFISENWPNKVFRYSVIKDNKGMMRIYFLKQLH